jgi:transposase
VSEERRAEVHRLFHVEHWPVGTIARQLHIHRTTVQRLLIVGGAEPKAVLTRPSVVDPYVPFIHATFAEFPTLCSSRLWEMVRSRGYTGAKDHFRAIAARYRPRRASEAFFRLSVLPGEQAQVDWAHFGTIRCDGYERPLVAFVMVLSHSRRIFLRFFRSLAMGAFLRGHVEALRFFGGVPRVMLYDNLKSAVLERRGPAIRFHPTLLELAAHYRFEPRPVGIRRGNEKGRVERAIRYVREAFFAARKFDGLLDLNEQARTWIETTTDERRHVDMRDRTVGEVFREEVPTLLKLPDDEFPAWERIAVVAGKTPYVRFDRNDYSIPHEHVRRTLAIEANEDLVRILDGTKVIAEHLRVYGARMCVEDRAHLDQLAARKRAAREHRYNDRLLRAVPRIRDFLARSQLAGSSLGAMVRQLGELLERFGAEQLTRAVNEALEAGTVHVGAVRHRLDWARERPPPVRIRLQPKAAEVVVQPHTLGGYDQLGREDKTDEQG